jgi:creatinine amidohydrolase
LGETVAARTAEKVQAKGQEVLVLPVLWTGLSEHHMSFGGTITLDNATFAAVVEGVVRSVLRHGFTRIVLLNAHGGNDNALRTIADDLTPKLGVPIVQFTYWYAAAVAIARILETQGGLQHACEAETAMMMAVRPDLVAEDRIPLAQSNTTPDVSDVVGGGVYLWRSIGSRSGSGVIGNPEAASKDKGEALFDAISSALADKLCNAELWALPWTSETLS